MTTLLAADGTNLAHRCWHAARQQADPVALAGMVARMVRAGAGRVHATHVVVAFDGSDAGHARRDLYPAYKAGRAETDPRLKAALVDMPVLVDGAGLPTARAAHAEADDVLARYATTAGIPTVLLTADKDAYALLALPDVRVLRPQTGGVSEWDLVDAGNLVDRVDVTPDAYALYAALKGDSSDNIPGVHGIGPTYAAKIARDLVTPDAFVDDIRTGGNRIRPVLGVARTAHLVTDPDRTVAELELALDLTRPLPVPHLPGLAQLAYGAPEPAADQLTFDAADTIPPDAPSAQAWPYPAGPACPHGMPGGGQPDPFVGGRLACPQCALELARRRK